jgi:LCP family protein required for cell wall assembly
MLSIPRDLRVEIPGHGTNKINAAYAFGGPSLLVETIKSNLNIGINHYVEVDFVGFQALIDEIGGIEIPFPNAARDAKSGLNVAAGTQRLNGSQALAYARSRSYQEQQGGSWVSVDANDIGRTQRQQEVMRAMMSRLKSPSSLAEAGDIASSMSRHTTIDSSLAQASPASLLWDFRGVLTGSVAGATLPTTTSNIGGVSFEIIKQPEADAMLANFRAGTSLASQPLRVEVLNGNGTAGRPARCRIVSSRSDSRWRRLETPGRATYEKTTVIVPSGSDAGSEITAALGFGVVEFGTVDNRYDAVVIVGADAS